MSARQTVPVSKIYAKMANWKLFKKRQIGIKNQRHKYCCSVYAALKLFITEV